MTRPLTAKDSIGTWLKHPTGGPLVRGYLAQAGYDEKVLAPFKLFSLETAGRMSGGRLTPSMIDRLVVDANRPPT